MTSFFKKMEKIKATIDSYGPRKYMVGGYQVICPHCKHDTFEEGSAQLNTAGLTFLGLDWLNKSATILACTNCGYIQWFGKSPEKI